MHDKLKYSEASFDTQVGFRVTESVAQHIPRLAEINGETRQEFFDRLVGEEFERYIIENAEILVSQNKQRIAELEAEIDVIQAIASGS